MKKPKIIEIAEMINGLSVGDARVLSCGLCGMEPNSEGTFFEQGISEVDMMLVLHSWAKACLDEWELAQDRQATEKE